MTKEWPDYPSQFSHASLTLSPGHLDSDILVVGCRKMPFAANNVTHIALTGHCDNRHPTMLDHKFFQHYAWFERLLPFLEHASQRWLLVNLGWVPQTSPKKLKGFIPIVVTLTIVDMLIPLKKRPFMHPSNSPPLLTLYCHFSWGIFSQCCLRIIPTAIRPRQKNCRA